LDKKYIYGIKMSECKKCNGYLVELKKTSFISFLYKHIEDACLADTIFNYVKGIIEEREKFFEFDIPDGFWDEIDEEDNNF